jgi:hypothetical protein
MQEHLSQKRLSSNAMFRGEMTQLSISFYQRFALLLMPLVEILSSDTEDKEWQLGTYEQFLPEDSDNDAIYDRCLNNML